MLENCPLDCLADPRFTKGPVPEPEEQRKFLTREFNQIFYRLKKQGASRFPYESLPMDFRWNLCSTRLRMGHFDNWDGWEFRGDFACTFLHRNFPTPKWMGQPITEELGLQVCGEQGPGDEILFMSALPDLMVRVGPKAIQVNCFPRLVPIFERSFKVKCVDRPKGLSDVKGQSMLLMGDLLRWYRKDGHFPRKPYLKPDLERVEQWQKRLAKLGERPKIGIAWKSRHGELNPRDLMHEDAVYVNLQYRQKSDSSENLISGSTGTSLFDPGIDPLQDLEGQFALVATLDKVVTVTQTVVHVAGSIGKECHAIVPPQGTGEVHNRLWYYGTGGQSPVYGSVQIYPSIDDYRSRRS
jgi:hypothetical protein